MSSTDDILREVEEMGKRALELEEAVRCAILSFFYVFLYLLSLFRLEKRKNVRTTIFDDISKHSLSPKNILKDISRSIDGVDEGKVKI